MRNAWIVRQSDNRFLEGGGSVREPKTGELLVELQDDRMPDPIRERYDPQSPWMRRPATAAELNEARLEQADAHADAESRQKLVLALMGTMLEKFDPSWAGMTLAQKKAAVNDMATRFAQIRRWVERNL